MLDKKAYENILNYNEPFEINQDCINETGGNDQIHFNLNKDLMENKTPLYTMTVDLDQERSDKLEIFYDSVPEKVAFQFCKKHNLDFDEMQFLIDEISKLIINIKVPLKNYEQCIQEVDEEMNSGHHHSNEVSIKEISNNKDNPINFQSPQNDKSLVTVFANHDYNKTNNFKNLSYNNNSNLMSQSSSSITRFNNQCKINKNEGAKPLEYKQFSYQLFEANSIKSENIPEMPKESRNNKPSQTVSKTSIYEKLYQDSNKRKNNKKIINKPIDENVNNEVRNRETQLNLEYSNKTHINYGEILYNRGLKMKEKSSKKIEKIKEEKVISDKEIYTFQPIFCQNIYDYNTEFIKARLTHNNTDKILNFQQYKINQIEKLKQKHTKDENFSFSPEINKNTESILKTKLTSPIATEYSSNNLPKSFELIHDKYKQRLLKIKKLEESIYSNLFTPSTNHNIPVQKSFNERQEYFKRRIRDHSEELQNKLKYDTKTGQRMFSPKREKSYTNNIITIREKDLNRKNLSEYMYSYAKKFLNKKEQLCKINDENFNKTLKMNHTNTYTEVMFKNIKFVVFKKIFHLMDRDSKKVISNFNIDLKDIPSSISDILEPIIYKIKMENCRLDEDNFIECCNLIFDLITYEKKMILLNFNRSNKRNKIFVDNFSCRPLTSKTQDDRNSKSIEKKNIYDTTSSSINQINNIKKYHNFNNLAPSIDTIIKDKSRKHD